MTGYNHINEFKSYLLDNRVRRLTVIEYRRRGGIWKRQSGEIVRHPEFGGGALGTSVRMRLHQDLENPFGGYTDLFLLCEYDQNISFEQSKEKAEGVLHGFTNTGGYKVDIVAHAGTR